MRATLPFLLAVCASALATGAQAAATPAPAGRDCFLTTQWSGWTAPRDGNGDVLLFRIHLNDVYRVDLIPGSHIRKDSDRFLVNRVRGSAWICSPLDLDLTLSDHFGFIQPVFVKSLRKLTPEEIAAIPKKDLPY